MLVIALLGKFRLLVPWGAAIHDWRLGVDTGHQSGTLA